MSFEAKTTKETKPTKIQSNGISGVELSTSARRILEQMRVAEDNFLPVAQARSKQFAVYELLNAGLIKDKVREGVAGYGLTRVIRLPD